MSGAHVPSAPSASIRNVYDVGDSSFGLTDDGEPSLEPLAGLSGRHPAAWPHRARLELALGVPGAHEVSKARVPRHGSGSRRLLGERAGAAGEENAEEKARKPLFTAHSA